MKNLPIHQVIPKIINTLQTDNRLVLQAPPGAGKTTAVPLALLNEPWLQERQIIMLEPRRLATRNAAARMAELLGEKVGEHVGYIIRDDRCFSEKSKILVVTEGILTRMLQSDPALESTALIIFDEFHERSLHADLALALSLQSQELLRDDLKILVMSATLHTEAISTLLNNAPVITTDGRSFPVENIYLSAKETRPLPWKINSYIEKLFKETLTKERGSILIFLPGVKEIKDLASRLSKSAIASSHIIAPLYGDMSKQSQDAAIRVDKSGRPKIVLATNIAETSLTIEGITVVIDSGLQRVSTFDSGSGMNTLKTVSISQDSATQRSGRAGRLNPGKSYRLWHEHSVLVPHSSPEILNSDLTPVMLELANWGVKEFQELKWLDIPASTVIDHATILLHQLGALKENTITPHGRNMLKLGIHPRLSHMCIKAQELNETKNATYIAALLSEKDIFSGASRYSADLQERVRVLQEDAYTQDLDQQAYQRVRRTANSLYKKLITKAKVSSTSKHEMIGVLLGFAYPDRIAKSRSLKSNRYLLSGGKGATLHMEDALFTSAYLVIADLDAAKQNATIYKAAAITKEAIKTYFRSQLTAHRFTNYNEVQSRVETREQLRLGALIMEESAVKSSDQDLQTALVQYIQAHGIEILDFSKETLRLQQRIGFLNHQKVLYLHNDKVIPKLPTLSDTWLSENLQQWLTPHIAGIKTLKALQRQDFYTMLITLFTWEQQKLLEKLAPSKLKVPSGLSIAINYQDPDAPMLSVQLQQLFGMLNSPALLNGSVPLTIELLSPAKRPMQITKDLKSFWDNTYTEVAKELRGKYKKHYWPEDPYDAVPTSKTKKHMLKKY